MHSGRYFWKRDHQGDYAQREANPVRGIFGAHGGHEERKKTADVLEV